MQKHEKIEWDTYPKTPEQFRQTVRMAVKAGLAQEQRSSGPEQEQQSSGPAQEQQKSMKRKKSKHWYKVWLPAAAILAVGCIAAAAGTGWLKEHLLERGFTEPEADVLIETEPQQQVSELTDVVYPNGAPIKKEWAEQLLTIQEAYFDGDSLYFIAEPSEEADSYDLYLRDHASVNGKDGMTSLSRLEDENLYFGQIEIWDKEDITEILKSDTVEVDMTVTAYPRYEGRVLYTWTDAEAYEQIFGTGAFQTEDGWLCYVAPFKDVIAGYTPHELKVEIPLTEEGKQVIEQYLARGDLNTENPDINAEAQDSLQIQKSGDSANDAETGTSASEDKEAQGTGAEKAEIQEASAEAADSGIYIAPAIEGDHVTGEIPGEGGRLKIDARIVQETDKIYTGTLHAEAFSGEVLKSLYEEGNPDLWTEIGENSLQYQEQNIFASSDAERTYYSNDEIGTQEAGDEETLSQEELSLQLCSQVLEKLGLTGDVEENIAFSDETTKYYRAKLLLEGLPVAWNSQWNMACSMQIENGYLSYVFAPSKLELVEKEEVTLPGIEKALERVEKYVREGEVDFTSWEVQPVTEIALEYYVDLTKQGLVFRPIWNFKLTFLPEAEETWVVDGHIYIDALTGALVRDTTGW